MLAAAAPVAALWLAAVVLPSHAAGASAPAMREAPKDVAAKDITQWIERMHQASRSRSYTGTFVVLSATGAMASSRIWHVAEGRQQIERVDALNGSPRIVFRRDAQVRTYMPETRTVRTEQRDVAGLFPQLPAVGLGSIGQFYSARLLGQERVAGLTADVVAFQPQDDARFGYRIWSDQGTGLVVKLQTLAGDGRVLEQAAFSQLEFAAPVSLEQLARAMDNTEGYRSEVASMRPTSTTAEGWTLREPVAGFVLVNCYRRDEGSAARPQAMVQCIYSDGLATVSLFLERLDASQKPTAHQISMGATHTLAQRIAPDGWLTAVGEVPLPTLKRFAAQIERVR